MIQKYLQRIKRNFSFFRLLQYRLFAFTFISLITIQVYGICQSRFTGTLQPVFNRNVKIAGVKSIPDLTRMPINHLAGNSAITIASIADVVINENSPYTSVTPSIKGTPAGSIAYTLSGRDAFDFTIDHSTGVVSMIGRNFESPADDNKDNVYEVTITATDAVNNSDSESWKVSIKDVIEAATFTIGTIADVTVNENSVYTSAIPVISGTPIGGTAPENFTIVPIPDTQYYT
ncbi:MAG TPA: hypothetical protein DIT07_16730, partial [Sphingobacteriaceae bacterium]|nr:hypothetical protein [Sphingobacteriaceae bacterium]